METMNITSAQYIIDELSGETSSIKTTIDGKVWTVPINSTSRRYAEIMRQVEDGSLVISPAEGEE